tara:strand:- start:1632 stop:1883 length:252 start_codon:yes stop_codon:yes gene_type:complete
MGKWEKRKRPLCLEGRFEFKSYEETRDFLDKLALLSENSNFFPDISFGKTYVNLTIRPREENDINELTQSDINFTKEIDGLVD